MAQSRLAPVKTGNAAEEDPPVAEAIGKPTAGTSNAAMTTK